MTRPETLWQFETENFTVRCTAEPEHDIDLSWADTGEIREGLESGRYVAFRAKVAVHLNGTEIGTDYLGQCIYRSGKEFVTSHRDPDPMNRSCSLNARNIGHYFPDMVATAISDARNFLRSIPKTRVT